MKKVFKILIPLIILGAIWYQWGDTIRARLTPLVNEIIARLGMASAPCQKPIAYTLGTFDPEFGISRSYFLDALKEAETIWEKPLGESFGKELFAYDENGKDGGVLKINLVYDYRQQATEKLASLGIVVKDTRASYDALKAKFTELKIEYEKAKSDYEARVQSFNARQKAYEEQVKYWNSRGGAPKGEYDKLQAEKSALDAQVSQLRALQAQLNEMVEEINALVVVLNRIADTLNLSVEKYNTIGASRGESFTEGVYFSDGLSREIDIYEFSSREKLVRVLAHELGHALNLDHLDDPKAIMYELNQGNNKSLTEADLDALKEKCGVE